MNFCQTLRPPEFALPGILLEKPRLCGVDTPALRRPQGRPLGLSTNRCLAPPARRDAGCRCSSALAPRPKKNAPLSHSLEFHCFQEPLRIAENLICSQVLY